MTSVLNKARSIKDLEAYIKWLLYGSKGAGKTYIAGRAPKPLFFDFERSTETLRHSLETLDVPVLQARIDFRTMVEFRDTVFDAIRSDYETLVFDTGTRMQHFQTAEYLKNVMGSTAVNAEVWNNPDEKKRSQFLLYQGDYKYSTELLDSLFAELQLAPINVIFTAHERKIYEKMPNGSEKLIAIIPDLTPALSERVVGLQNVVGYLESAPNGVGVQERRLYVNPGPIIEAKNRLGIEELFLKNPSFSQLVKERDNNG